MVLLYVTMMADLFCWDFCGVILRTVLGVLEMR
jgi:hypothetical protein